MKIFKSNVVSSLAIAAFLAVPSLSLVSSLSDAKVQGLKVCNPTPGFTGVSTINYTVQDNVGLTSAPTTITVIVSSPGTTSISGSVFSDTDSNDIVSANETGIPLMIMDLHLDSLLNLPQVTVFTCQQQEGFILLKLELLNSGINCPHCQTYTDNLHQTRPILVNRSPDLKA